MLKRYSVLTRFLAPALVVLLSCILFPALNRFDNKYAQGAPQAINGALYIAKTDQTETPIRYLRDGWRYYSDRLLTPETLTQQGDNYRYISIGAVTNFSMGDTRRSPHGSASYAMTLHLPKEEHTYSIELPEIYSAYRFYVNDRLLLEMGDSTPASYRNQMQCRMVTFQASEKATLLLAVSDFSWIYSGLVYPPALGEPLALNTSRALRVGTNLISATITLMFSILSLYLAIRTKGRRRNTWLFFLLCLAATLFISYSVVHSILSMPIQPWYSIELCSGYLVTLFVVMLHNRICNTGFWAQKTSEIMTVTAALLSLLYGLFAAKLTLPVMRAYSLFVLVLKLLAVLYLLVTAARAVHRSDTKATILLYADIFYACAFLWDRLLPDYEPILGGWFQEWGSLALVVALGIVLWADVAQGYRHSLIYAEEQRQMQRQLAMQVEHLRQMDKKMEESSKLRHDFRHHLRTLMTLSQEKRNDELQNYIRSIAVINENTQMRNLTENVELDALVQYYGSLSQSGGIKFETRLQLPAKLNFPIVELCGLVGNLLENAVEACQRQQEGDRSIFIAGRLLNDQLTFVVDNTFDGKLRASGKGYLSSKRTGFGLGLTSVQETVARHGGVINLYADSKGFHAEVSLPLSTDTISSAYDTFDFGVY